MNHPRHPRHPRRRRGFTLLELTIAVAMMAIVTLSLYAAMTTAFRIRKSARGQVDGVAAAMIALDVVGQDLQSVLPPSRAATDDSAGTADENGEATADVTGDALPPMVGPFVGTTQGGPAGPAATVNFFALGRDDDAAADPAAAGDAQAVSVASADPTSDGVRQVELALDTSYTPPRLVRRIRRNVLSETALDIQDEPLLSGVRAFGLRYYDGANWQDQWDSAAQGDVLPYAVEITLELDQPSPTDPQRFYRLTQILPVACAKAPATDDATATP